MKTNKILSRIGSVALATAALLAAPALTACSSDSDVPTPDTPENSEPGLYIHFATPDMAVGTRAGAINGNNIAADNDEAKISSLWLYIFNSDNASQTTLTYAFDCTTRVANQVVNEWKDVNLGAQSGSTFAKPLPIASGTWRFYMVANLENYLSDADKTKFTPNVSGELTESLKSVSESDIQNMQLSFAGGKEGDFNLPETKKLPMGMYFNEVKVGGTADTNIDSDGNVVINGSGSTSIYCDMTFLCSAVRYSFIYDKTTFSWDVPQFDMDNSGIQFKNIMTGYKFNDEKAGIVNAESDFSTIADKFLTGAKCNLAPSSGTDFTSGQAFIDAPVNLMKTPDQNLANWATAEKHAFQGTIYLPSNYSTSVESKTTMQIQYKAGLDNTLTTKEIALPTNVVGSNNEDNTNVLTRGYFYDVIGKISSTGIEWNVSVKKWKKGTRQVIPL